MLRWDWFQSPETFLFFMYCLLRADYEVVNWQGIEIKRGQFVSSLLNMSHDTRLTVRKIRTALKGLEMTQDLTYETTNRYTLVTLCKYDELQGVAEAGRYNGRHGKGQSADNQMATGDKEKKGNKEGGRKKQVFTPPSLPEVEAFFDERGYSQEAARRAYEGYSVAGWKDSRGKPVISWKQKMIHVWFKQENLKLKSDETERVF